MCLSTLIFVIGLMISSLPTDYPSSYQVDRGAFRSTVTDLTDINTAAHFINTTTGNVADSVNTVYFGRIDMNKRKPRSERTFRSSMGRRRIEPWPELLEIEVKLRQKNLIFRKDIQKIIRIANSCGSNRIRDSVIRRLQWALEAEEIDTMRKPDAFRPYGPEFLLNRGNLHLLDQMDGVPFKIHLDRLLTGTVIVGPQQGGKSRLIVNMCRQIVEKDPGIHITIIDPKDGFSDYAPLLCADRIDIGQAAFDLCPPDKVNYTDFVFELMPPLADACGLIYGLDVLNEAAEIALDQRQRYIQQTGEQTQLSLQDIYAAIPLVKNTASGRRSGYKDAASTALSRILGRKGLFACRQGFPLSHLFSKNTILNCRSLTDDMQCRFLGLYLLYWKYQQARYLPETNRLQHLLIIDDASRFIGTAGNQFDAMSRTSPLGHLLAVLRSTGTGLLAATQLPAMIDPSILALSHTVLVVGGIAGYEHLRVISNFMSLNDEQTHAITQLKTREVVGLASGTAYPKPVHGWIPFVPDPKGMLT